MVRTVAIDDDAPRARVSVGAVIVAADVCARK